MYNPAIHTATNKPIGLTGKPVDARTYYYDAVNYVYRAYVSTAEVKAYLIGTDRIGQFSIIINTGGSLSAGVITGGTNLEWWFKDGILDANLVLKGSGGVTPPTPIVITAGVTTTPHTVAYAGDDSTGYVLRRTDGDPVNLIDNLTNVTYDGSDFVIYGDNLGDGTFANSFIFAIKP